MSDLIALAFEDEHRAAEVLNTLHRLQAEHLIDLDDAVVVVKNREGRLKLHQTHDLSAAGAAGGAWWGLLLGIIFSLPVLGPGALALPFLGALAGAAGGAIGGHFSDIGIDDRFIREVSAKLQPGSSAIFILVWKATLDEVLPELGRFEGTILHTSLSKEADEKLVQTQKIIEAQMQAARPDDENTW